jgi:hypothetical protein
VLALVFWNKGLDIADENDRYRIMSTTATVQSLFVFLLFCFCLPLNGGNMKVVILTRTIVGHLCGIPVVFFIATCLGAPILLAWRESLWMSACISAWTVVPCCCYVGLTDASKWQLLFQHTSHPTHAIQFVRLPAVTVIVCAWMSAFFAPLDWNMPWQVWPIPCFYCSFGGYMLGCLGVMCWAMWSWRMRTARSNRVDTVISFKKD